MSATKLGFQWNPLTKPLAKPVSDDWATAIASVRALPVTELGALMERWLVHMGFHAVKRIPATTGRMTLSAVFGAGRLTVETLVRIYQRQSALQAHHVDALAGELHRSGQQLGLLLTTGPIAPGTVQAARANSGIRLVLYDGPNLAASLADAALLRKRRPWCWDVDLPPLFTNGAGRNR